MTTDHEPRPPAAAPSTSATPLSIALPREEALPLRLSVEERPGAFALHRAWSGRTGRVLLPLLALASTVLLPLGVWSGELGVPAAVVLSLFFAPFSYAVLARGVNRTTVAVERGFVSVREGPLPWPGERSFRVDEIRALRTHVEVTREGVEAIDVRALLGDGREVPLVEHLGGRQQAGLVARLLEERLGVPAR